jgi:hypothetical protein
MKQADARHQVVGGRFRASPQLPEGWEHRLLYLAPWSWCNLRISD